MRASALHNHGILRRLVMPGVLAASVLLIRRAEAQAQKSVELSYVAPPSCPGPRVFTEEISARTEQARFVEEGAQWLLRVRIHRAEPGYSGQIEIVEQGQEPTTRQFEDDSCADIVASLALVAALAVDPNARLDRIERRPADQPVPPAPPAEAPAPPPAPREPRAPRAAATQSNWVVSAAAVAALTTAPAPKPLLAAGVGASVEDRRERVFSFAVGLTALAAETGVVGPEASDAHFRWTVVRLAGCPVRARTPPGLSLRPCVLADLGALRGTGDGRELTYTETRLWASAGLGLRARLDLGGHAFVQAAAGTLFSLTQDDFVFRTPEHVVHAVPAAGATAEAGAGAHF